MADDEKVWVSHPGIEGAVYMRRTLLNHNTGWTEVKDPDRAGKPTARRTAAAKNAAEPTTATATSETPLAAEVADLKEK